MTKIKQFLKEILNIEQLPDKELYFLLGVFLLIIVLGFLSII